MLEQRRNPDSLVELTVHPWTHRQRPERKQVLTQGQKYYLVDYGTGYFVERTAKQASEFCDRKNALIKEKSEKLGLLINDKKVMLEKCSMTLMSMMNQQQQQQQQAQK